MSSVTTIVLRGTSPRSSWVVTLVAGFFAYRVVKDRVDRPDPVDALVRAKK
jgi:hypothetical protein